MYNEWEESVVYEPGLVNYLGAAFVDSIISGRKPEFGTENFVYGNLLCVCPSVVAYP